MKNALLIIFVLAFQITNGMDLSQGPKPCSPEELIAHIKASRNLHPILAPDEKLEHTNRATASTENSVHQTVVCTAQNGNGYVSITSSVSITSKKGTQ